MNLPRVGGWTAGRTSSPGTGCALRAASGVQAPAMSASFLLCFARDQRVSCSRERPLRRRVEGPTYGRVRPAFGQQYSEGLAHDGAGPPVSPRHRCVRRRASRPRSAECRRRARRTMPSSLRKGRAQGPPRLVSRPAFAGGYGGQSSLECERRLVEAPGFAPASEHTSPQESTMRSRF